jgi:hypothetical protein
MLKLLEFMANNLFKIFKDMKYTVNLFLIIAITCIAVFTGCEDDDKKNTDDPSLLMIDQTELDVLSAGGKTLISVNTSLTWEATVDADWVQISPVSGNGSGTVAVEVDPRGKGERRVATLNFTAGGVTKTVYVLQRGFLESNYYKTGDVLKLHLHTVGTGISIVIIGDGFDREDCRIDGVYEYNARKLADLFLAMPVVRDFKEYFDIYARVDISWERGARNCVEDRDNCPENAYNVGQEIDEGKIFGNAVLTAGRADCSTIFMGNGGIGGYAMGTMAAYSADEPNKPYWMMHEFAGHVLGCLPDLYIQSYGSGVLDAGARRMIDDGHAGGQLLMLDYRTDPNTVYWKDFIGRPGYPEVGVFEAGHYSVKYGELRTCEPIYSVVMTDMIPHYSVMERYQIWRQIQQRAGFTSFSIPQFIEYDVINLYKTETWKDYEYVDWSDSRIWSYDD